MLNALGVAGIVWLLISPISLFTPSYQLSFAATFALIAFCPILLTNIKLPQMNGFLSTIFKGAISVAVVSFISFVATLPVLIFHFQQLYLYGLIANLFSVSLMSIAMWLSLAGFLAQIIFPPLVPLCMHASEWSVHIMIQLAGLVRFIPWSTMKCCLPYPEPYILFSLIIFGFLLLKSDYRVKFLAFSLPIGLAASILCIFIHVKIEKAQVVFFRTSNQLVTAIKWPNNQSWIIVNGEDKKGNSLQRTILPWENHQFNCRLSTILLPHYNQNVVHFIDPLLADNRDLELAYCDSTYKRDDDFISFVEHAHGSRHYLKNGEQLIPSPQCTCKTLIKRVDNKREAHFILRVFNSVVFVKDLEGPDSGNKMPGTCIISMGKNKMPIFETVTRSRFSPEY
jgi:hypothetical protein